MIQNLEKLHDEKQAVIESKKTRIINGGGGRKPKLSVQKQIILTLIYLRHMTTFQFLDNPEQRKRDTIERDNLRYNTSYTVLTLRHDENWQERLEYLTSL